MNMEAFQEPGDACTLATYFRPVFRIAEEFLPEVFVAKTGDHVFASHDGFKKTYILIQCGIEAAIPPAVLPGRPGKAVEFLSGPSGILHWSQCIKVAMIG